MFMMGKNFIKMLLIAGVCIFINTDSFASGNEPQIMWDKQGIDGVEFRNHSQTELVDDNILSAVGKMLDNKLTQLKAAGKLPFKMLIIDSYQNNDWQSKMMQEEYIAILPVITSDLCQRRVIQYKNTNYYSYTVRAEMNVLLCTFDGSNLKIFYNLPLANQAVLGGSLEEGLNEPLSDQILKEQFLYNLEQLVEEVEFPQNLNKQLNNPYLVTYQVADVEFAPSVQTNFDEAQQQMVKKILASSFSSQYANRYHDRIVLPNVFSGKKWKKAAVQHISGASINSAEYNPEQEDLGDVPLYIKMNSFNGELSAANKYSLMNELSYSMDLTAFEGLKQKVIGEAKSVTTYRLPKDLNYVIDTSSWEILDTAAKDLGHNIKDK